MSGPLGSFNLALLEAQDRQLKFQGVRFEASKALRSMSNHATSANCILQDHWYGT